MHIISHVLINGLIGFLMQLSMFEILLIILGGILIDLDHLLYIVCGEKINSLKKAWKFHKKEYKLMRPHLFIFHFLEPIIIFSLVFYFVEWHIFLVFFGFFLHWITDAIKYLCYYKSFFPWLKYYSLIFYLVKCLN